LRVGTLAALHDTKSHNLSIMGMKGKLAGRLQLLKIMGFGQSKQPRDHQEV
jgi:hypothetical protein